MSGMKSIGLCLFFFIILGYKEIEGYTTSSEEDDLEMVKQLQLLNKPAIKTIHTDYGEIYDCVNFNKQPAFDNSLLRNHTYNLHMKPELSYAEKEKDTMYKGMESVIIQLSEGGCPTGSVPIKRTKKEDLIREKLLAQRLDVGGVHYAVVQTKSSITNKFLGAEGFISLYKPVAQGKQYSAARIKIQNGINGSEFIAFGWRVDPALYGDNMCHFYVQTSTNSAKCFDARCGFVVVDKNTTPGIILPNTTIPSSDIYYIRLFVEKAKDGSWLLGTSNGTLVGYWPHNLFTEPSDFGTLVEWGGEVYSPPGTPGPEMGAGHEVPLFDDVDKDAFIQRISIVDINGKIQNPDTVHYEDDSSEYRVDDETFDDDAGHIIWFGGRGNTTS